MQDLFLGHTTSYWLELNKRPKELNVTDLIKEIVELKGKLAFITSRLQEITTALQEETKSE